MKAQASLHIRMEVDEGTNQKSDSQPHWMASHWAFEERVYGGQNVP